MSECGSGSMSANASDSDDSKCECPHECPNLAEWIKYNLVYGDCPGYFLRSIDKDSINNSCLKIAKMMYFQITRIFYGDEPLSYCTSGEIYRMILFLSPFPGFIKYVTRIDLDMDDTNYSLKDLFAAYIEDGKLHDDREDKLSLFKMMNEYYGGEYHTSMDEWESDELESSDELDDEGRLIEHDDESDEGSDKECDGESDKESNEKSDKEPNEESSIKLT
jgi:hypothetical protein